MVHSSSRLIDVLLDAEMIAYRSGEVLTVAALRDPHDIVQWHSARTTLDNLRQLAHVKRHIEGVLSTTNPFTPGTEHGPQEGLSENRSSASMLAEAMGRLLEATQDISSSLGRLARAQEEWLAETADQGRELLLVGKNLDRNIAELVNAIGNPGDIQRGDQL